jgi:hypothetical protein
VSDWTFDKSVAPGGRYQLWITRHDAGGRATNVTSFRRAPTQLGPYSSADPFGDAAAEFTFPNITPMDDLSAPDLHPWLAYYADVDLFWVPSLPAGLPGFTREPPSINPITGRLDVITPSVMRNPAGLLVPGDPRIKVWEGFLASREWTADGSSASLTVQCQGANFQLDRYLQKPFFPPQPWPLELLIADAFDHKRKPDLRMLPLRIVFPPGWTFKMPRHTESTTYTPVGHPGANWSGYCSRQTGAWEHCLTGFVQDQLTGMITDERSGVTPGNQWTITHSRASSHSPRGREPMLQVRDRYRTPDFSVWVGTPGLDVRLSEDSTQSENIIYGEGTDSDGTMWRNAVISNDGGRTDYLPLAASRNVWPPSAANAKSGFTSEAMLKLGDGFSQVQGVSIAKQQLARDEQPGYSGSLTLRTDPSVHMPKALIRAGMTMLLKGFLGTGDSGVAFHISAVSTKPMDGSVELTVDSRYRDLLTVQEALNRARDPLSPIKMLQVNRTSVLLEDLQTPWDYHAGSGYVPRATTEFHRTKPAAEVFPYVSWRQAHPPLHYPQYYVKVNAAAPHRTGRWTQQPVAILTSEQGSIVRTEFACCDLYGRPLKVPFHVSIYYVNVHPGDMPHSNRDALGPSPYIDNAFEKIDPATGQAWDTDTFLAPEESFIIGWGNRSAGIYNRAGFWPGRESVGGKATGLLVDEAPWPFNNVTGVGNHGYLTHPLPGQRQATSAISLYAMFYCEYSAPVYFQGRLYRLNPGPK